MQKVQIKRKNAGKTIASCVSYYGFYIVAGKTGGETAG